MTFSKSRNKVIYLTVTLLLAVFFGWQRVPFASIMLMVAFLIGLGSRITIDKEITEVANPYKRVDTQKPAKQ